MPDPLIRQAGPKSCGKCASKFFFIVELVSSLGRARMDHPFYIVSYNK